MLNFNGSLVKQPLEFGYGWLNRHKTMRTNLEGAVSYEGMRYNQYDQVALF